MIRRMLSEQTATWRRVNNLIQDSEADFDRWWKSLGQDVNPDYEWLARDAWNHGTRYRLGQELFEQRRQNTVLWFVIVLWAGLVVTAIFN